MITSCTSERDTDLEVTTVTHRAVSVFKMSDVLQNLCREFKAEVMTRIEAGEIMFNKKDLSIDYEFIEEDGQLLGIKLCVLTAVTTAKALDN